MLYRNLVYKVFIVGNKLGGIRIRKCFAADQLAQLVERRTTVREVSGSSPRLDQHSGSWNNWGEYAAFAMTSANGLIF